MSIELALDPRSELVKRKYFSLHPKPLERWLWKQDLPPAAERVFWLHWEAGMQNGDWCSEIPLKRVALECCVNPSTVTRAYQFLKALDLIRREDPGRDPSNPFQQATAITEVRLPRELITELSRSPNRPVKGANPVIPAARIEAPQAHQTEPLHNRTATREEIQALWSRASAAERSRYFVAARDRLTSFEFDASTQLTPEDRGEILRQLAQVAAARPLAAQSKTPAAARLPQGPRRLTVVELARARSRVQESVPNASLAETFRQVIWAMEEGALQRFAPDLALNIAMKKIREGVWGRPNRMPPNWMPRALPKAFAHPEPCNAA